MTTQLVWTYSGLLLLGIGSSFAMFKNLIGQSWFQFHRVIQSSAIIVLLISIFMGDMWPVPLKWIFFGTLVGQALWAGWIRTMVQRDTFLWGHRFLAVAIWGLVLYKLGEPKLHNLNPIQ